MNGNSIRVDSLRPAAFIRILLVALAVYGAAIAALLLLRESKLVFNDLRGAPTLAIFHGVPIYQVGLKNVSFSVLYGPFSYLFHLPAAFCSGLQSYFLVGSSISLALYCAPIFLFLFHARAARPGAAWIGLLLAIAFAFFTMNTEGLVYSSMAFSPDAAALGFAGLACTVLFFHDGRRLWLDPVLIGAFTWCAIGSKQNLVMLLAILPLFGLILYGRAFATRLIVCAGAGLLVSAAVVWAVYRDLWAVYFNNVTMPNHFPRLWDRAPFGLQYLYVEGVLLLFVLGLLVFLSSGRVPREVLHFLKRNQRGRLALFAVMTLCVTPFSVMGLVFWGGAYNALSPSLYFGLLTLVAFAYLLLVELPLEWPNRSMALAVVLLFVVIEAPLLSKYYYPLSAVRNAFRPSSPEIVYRYSLRHPGAVYFPFNQVSVFFAEHKFYHADWGIGNLIHGKVPFSKEEVTRNVPPSARYVAYPPEVSIFWLTPYVAPREKRVEAPELPGFSVFEVEQ